jgi:hypothetical protein
MFPRECHPIKINTLVNSYTGVLHFFFLPITVVIIIIIYVFFLRLRLR